MKKVSKQTNKQTNKQTEIITRKEAVMRAARRRPKVSFKGVESLTHQSFAESHEINNIVARFARGIAPPMNNRQPQYGEAPSVDLHQLMNVRSQVQQVFDALPEAIRSRYNDAAEFAADALSGPLSDENAEPVGRPTPEGENASEGLSGPLSAKKETTSDGDAPEVV